MRWRKTAEKHQSKGLITRKAISLADLHRRREETQSQYFTPLTVSSLIWNAFKPVIDEYNQKGVNDLTVFDNSVGSGRLFEGAPVDMLFSGLDTDSELISKLSADAEAASISHNFQAGSMADLYVAGFDFAVINPPFSLHLESPHLMPYDCNTYGKYGERKAATSHLYALEQALDGAHYVAAVLPVSMDEYCRAKDRLAAVAYLPKNTFLAEGANVATAVYFFVWKKQNQTRIVETRITTGLQSADFKIPLGFLATRRPPKFQLEGIDESTNVITLPVTHDSRVELHHHNRKIVRKYHCGLTQAKVENGLLRGAAEGDRLPSEIKYQGDGRFLLDVLLSQDKPESQLDILSAEIRQLGGEPVITPTLLGYYKKLIKKNQRALIPMRRVIKQKSVDHVTLVAKKRTLLVPGDFNSPSIAMGQTIGAKPRGGDYELSLQNHTVILRRDQIVNRFDFKGGIDDVSSSSEWTELHPGLNKHFPELAHQHEKHIDRLGIDWLAPFQRESLIEGMIKPSGYIGAWEQGSGKARYSLALALCHSGKNMIALESGLVPEMIKELEKLKIDQNLYRILKKGDMPTAKINIVSYRTLRQRINRHPKAQTNSELWRRQINVLVCDEGGLLANINTQQSHAVKALSARKVIVLDGTPQRNYPRDLLPLSVISAGNGMSHQPMGVKGKPFISHNLIRTASQSQRGEDLFRENHIVAQWVTHQFTDDLQKGGKREVPRINGLHQYREWLAPNIQRRLRSEPDLAIFNNCPTPEREVITVSWDDGHLGHYLKTALDFANWYKKGEHCSNLVAVLARIGAVQRAANCPHIEGKLSLDIYAPTTSKQHKAVERLKYYVNEGRKVILYAQSPDVLMRLHSMLDKDGIDSILFTGKQNINDRARALDEEFRFGKTQVLLASMVGNRGLNLEQASAVIFYNRCWSHTAEEQAIYRTQRPDQKARVMVEYLHLAGSIDSYCQQLTEWKGKASDAGLDFGDQMGEDEEFVHLDSILSEFCDDILGLSTQDAKELFAA